MLKKTDQLKALPVNLINDGEIIHNNLRVINKDDAWLKRTLKKQGITDYEKIFSCEYTKNEPLAIQWR
ncbi:MAG: YetF domain-containing protein [Bacillota bacterium]